MASLDRNLIEIKWIRLITNKSNCFLQDSLENTNNIKMIRHTLGKNTIKSFKWLELYKLEAMIFVYSCALRVDWCGKPLFPYFLVNIPHPIIITRSNPEKFHECSNSNSFSIKNWRKALPFFIKLNKITLNLDGKLFHIKRLYSIAVILLWKMLIWRTENNNKMIKVYKWFERLFGCCSSMSDSSPRRDD